MFFVEELLSITMKLLKKLIILIALVIVYVFSNAVSIYIYSFKDEARTADVAIVLGASTYNGHASPVYQERINHAVVLYNKHLVKKIITTGGYGKGNPVSDAYNAKLYAISQGVPEMISLQKTSQQSLWRISLMRKRLWMLSIIRLH